MAKGSKPFKYRDGWRIIVTLKNGTRVALRNITEDWGRAANNWKSAMNQFAILYEDRFMTSST